MIVYENGKTPIKKEYREFQESGLLWWINMILHTFGWAIHLEINDKKEVVGMYPQRRGYRGFSEKNNDNGYEKVTKYMKDNAVELYEEVLINK